MGLFSSKKKVYVSSVVYNLAGDEKDRPNYLKTTVIGAVFSNTPSIAGAVSDAYLSGPGIRLRGYTRWARTSDYISDIGWQTGKLYAGNSIHLGDLTQQIPAPSGMTVTLQTATIDTAEYSYWADQYITVNFPERIGTAYRADMNESTGQISVVWEDNTSIVFTPSNYDSRALYLYASYALVGGSEVGPLVPGETINLGSSEAFPSIAGWNQLSYDSEKRQVDLETVVETLVTYSDGRPDEFSTDTVTNTVYYTYFDGVWDILEYKGMVPDREAVFSEKRIMSQYQSGIVNTTTDIHEVTEDIGGGVLRTTHTTVTADSLQMIRNYRIDTQDIIHQSWSGPLVFIYKYGSGNSVLDTMFETAQNSGSFMPFVPFRVNNESLPDSWPGLYPKTKRAFRKMTGGKYDKVLSSINENESIGDIDYAYAVLGVPLNVKENASKRYIYEFFKTVEQQSSVVGIGAYQNWKIQWAAAHASWNAWIAWRNLQNSSPSSFDPEPTRIPYPPMPVNSLQILTGAANLNYNITLYWNYVQEATGAGILDSSKKIGDMWFTVGSSEVFSQWVWVTDYEGSWGSYATEGERHVNDVLTLNWQVTDNSWRQLTLVGLRHKNLIYGGKSVEITGREAILDPDESGFIVPLHEDVYRAISLRDGTQMATACCYMVFNCYEVVKQKWYQSGIFKVILVVVTIVIAVYSGGAGAGLLGPAATVGASLGFTGMTAIIVGSVANALAAMILVQIIQVGATALFGDKIGAIVAAVVSIVAMQVGTSLMNGGSLATSFNGLLKADNILRLTSSVGNGYSQYMSAAANEYMQKTEDVMRQYNIDSRAIQTAWEQNIGYNRGIIDPMMLTDVATVFNESPESFLSRTLLTGSEVAEMSINMLTRFTEVTLSTELV